MLLKPHANFLLNRGLKISQWIEENIFNIFCGLEVVTPYLSISNIQKYDCNKESNEAMNELMNK